MTISTRALARAAYFALAVAAPVVAFPPLASAQVAVDISVQVAPPPLVEYDQPAIPAAGYIWTPGYWAWDASDSDYYWTPGVWVQPPRIGVLWTPGYWAWNNGAYVFNTGYWGETVGFYGGVDYGFGYTSEGYYGGRWRGNTFEYNKTVNNISNVHITNVYEEQAPRSSSQTRVSYNGGQGGTTVKPTERQMAVAKEQHVEATAAQRQEVRVAQQDKDAHFKANHGKPPVTAMSKPGERPDTQKSEAEQPKSDKSGMKAEAPNSSQKSDAKAEAETPAAKADAEKAKTEAERKDEKPTAKTEAERKDEKPAAKTEAERKDEKPAMKAEEQHPATKMEEQRAAETPAAKAVDKAPPDKVEAPRAAEAQHPQQERAQAGPKKEEPKKGETP